MNGGADLPVSRGDAAASPYQRTLGRVREFSERATLRPSPLRLRCVAWQPFRVCPVNAFVQRMNRKVQIRLLLDEIAASGQLPTANCQLPTA